MPESVAAARLRAAPTPGAAPPFFPVSERKLLVLSLLTFSLYQFYWFYRNWQIEKQREHPQIMPMWRAVLVYFFCYSLFRRISERAATHRIAAPAAGWLAVGWIITSLMGELPPPYFFALFLTVFFVLPVQRAAIAVNEREAPDHDRNDRFTGWNALWVGVCLMTAALVWLAIRRIEQELGL